jgi:hypothetical protein
MRICFRDSLPNDDSAIRWLSAQHSEGATRLVQLKPPLQPSLSDDFPPQKRGVSVSGGFFVLSFLHHISLLREREAPLTRWPRLS